MPCMLGIIRLSTLNDSWSSRQTNRTMSKAGQVSIKCHHCDGELSAVDGYPVGYQVTSDCRPWKPSGYLSSCDSCGLVQKPVSTEWAEDAAEIYSGYQIYSQSGGKEQSSFNTFTGAIDGRSNRLVSWMVDQGGMPVTGRLLDVGCGNGAFLEAFGSIFKTWQMVGLELDGKHRERIESIPGVSHLHVGGFEGIVGTFDLIVLIHSLEHIPHPSVYLRSLAKILSPQGRLLIQVPNLEESPFDLLIADHCSHFSVTSVARIVRESGLSLQYVSTQCIGKEITVLASLGDLAIKEVPRTNPGGVSDRQMAVENLQWLSKLLDRGNSEAERVGVFGSSISASWLASTLGDHVEFFVDEDPSRAGRAHLGRPIFDVQNAPKSTPILMPLLFEVAVTVSRRLQASGLHLVLPPKRFSSL
jgi:hypothetical protein